MGLFNRNRHNQQNVAPQAMGQPVPEQQLPGPFDSNTVVEAAGQPGGVPPLETSSQTAAGHMNFGQVETPAPTVNFEAASGIASTNTMYAPAPTMEAPVPKPATRIEITDGTEAALAAAPVAQTPTEVSSVPEPAPVVEAPAPAPNFDTAPPAPTPVAEAPAPLAPAEPAPMATETSLPATEVQASVSAEPTVVTEATPSAEVPAEASTAPTPVAKAPAPQPVETYQYPARRAEEPVDAAPTLPATTFEPAPSVAAASVNPMEGQYSGAPPAAPQEELPTTSAADTDLPLAA